MTDSQTPEYATGLQRSQDKTQLIDPAQEIKKAAVSLSKDQNTLADMIRFILLQDRTIASTHSDPNDPVNDATITRGSHGQVRMSSFEDEISRPGMAINRGYGKEAVDVQFFQEAQENLEAKKLGVNTPNFLLIHLHTDGATVDGFKRYLETLPPGGMPYTKFFVDKEGNAAKLSYIPESISVAPDRKPFDPTGQDLHANRIYESPITMYDLELATKATHLLQERLKKFPRVPTGQKQRKLT